MPRNRARMALGRVDEVLSAEGMGELTYNPVFGELHVALWKACRLSKEMAESYLSGMPTTRHMAVLILVSVIFA